MSWRRDGSLQWRQTAAEGRVRLEFRDLTRVRLGGGAGAVLVGVLGWSLWARIERGDADTPSLMMQAVMTLILAAFAVSAVVSRVRFDVGDGWLAVQGRPAVPLEAVVDVEPVRRGAYAGLAVRRSDGVLEALAPVFLSREKADRVGARLRAALEEVRAAASDSTGGP